MGWYDDLVLKYRAIHDAGSPLPPRGAVNYTGSGVSVTDDPVNNRTNVSITAGGGVAVATTTADFTQPDVGDSVDVQVDTSTPFIVGGPYRVEVGGFYNVLAVIDVNNITITNTGFQGNALPGANIASGAGISAGGPVAPLYYIDATLPPYSMVSDWVSDGVGTDNTPLLQAAIDDLAAGGTIVLPGGGSGYRLAGSAARPGIAGLVDKRVTFLGNGSGQDGTNTGTALMCDSGVTGFITTYALGNAAGKDAAFRDLAILAAARLTTTQPCSWNGTTHTATIAGAGDFKNGQIVCIPGGAGLLPLEVTAVTCATVSGSPTLRLAGYPTFLDGMYLVVGGAFASRTLVSSVNYLDFTPGVYTNRWVNNHAYAQFSNVLPRVNNGFAYRATTGGTSGATLGDEPAWPAELGRTVSDNGIVWQCVVAQDAPVTLTMAKNASGTVGNDLVLRGAQVSMAFDVAGRIVSGGGSTTLVLDTHGNEGDGSTVPPYPFTGSPGTTDLNLEHHDSGIYGTAIFHVTNCALGSPNHGFQGAGAVVYGSAADAEGPSNSNFSSLHNVWAFHNKHAVQIGGSDANRVQLTNVRSITSRSWSFIDGSGLGAVWDNLHADGGYGYLTAATPGTATGLRDCYIEGGTHAAIGPGATIRGGNLGASWGGTYLGTQNANLFSIGKCSGASKYSVHELGVEQQKGWIQLKSEDNPEHELRMRRSDVANDGILGYVVLATQSNEAGRVKYSDVFLDHDVPDGYVGARWLPDRIYVGGGLDTGDGNVALSNAIAGRVAWAWSSAAPTAGTWELHARVWNDRSIDTTTDFWECTVAGTPGTWRADTANPNTTWGTATSRAVGLLQEVTHNDASGHVVGNYTVPDECGLRLNLIVNAKIDGAADLGSWTFSPTYARDGAGPIVNRPATADTSNPNSSGTAITCTLGVSGNDVQVTGTDPDGRTVHWEVFWQGTERFDQ